MAEHPRARINYDPSHFLLQAMDYLAFIDLYHDRISASHVKDAELRPMGGRASIPAIRHGPNGPGGFAALAMGRWTSPPSSRG